MAPNVDKKRSNSKKSTAAASKIALPSGGPGSPIEIVFSFDTTGSMSGCINEVKTKVQEVIKRLFNDIPNLRIAVFAHGDYCDASNYVTKYVDFSNDQAKLCDFVSKVKGTGGGDWEECYELVLRQAREKLSWQPGTQRSLVMIGDAIPHEASYPANKLNIDWKTEVKDLKDLLGMRIYSVQCGGSNINSPAGKFYKYMSDHTQGKHLMLNKFETIVDFIMAICYREHGPDFYEAYEAEIRSREGKAIRSELDDMLVTLRDPEVVTTPPSDTTAKTTPVAPTVKVAKKVSTTKVTAIRKPKTAVKTTARKLKKFAPAIKGQLRENAASAGLLGLEWCSWKTGIVPKQPADQEHIWIERNGSRPGFRHANLFKEQRGDAAIYEIAVQPRFGCKRYPVHWVATEGFSSRRWDAYLMRQERVQKQVDSAVKRGCKLFVRRAAIKKNMNINGTAVKSVQELQRLVKDTYDYAWRAESFKGRSVQKSGVDISQKQ